MNARKVIQTIEPLLARVVASSDRDRRMKTMMGSREDKGKNCDEIGGQILSRQPLEDGCLLVKRRTKKKGEGA